MAEWNNNGCQKSLISQPPLLSLGKGGGLSDVRIMIRMYFLCPRHDVVSGTFFITSRFNVQFNRLVSYRLSSPSLCNWRIPSFGTACLHTLRSSVSRSGRVAALQRAPDAVALVWKSQECSPQKKDKRKNRDCEAAASLHPWSQLSSYEVIPGVRFILQQCSRALAAHWRGARWDEWTPTQMFYPGVEVPRDRCSRLLPFLPCVQKHTNTESCTAPSLVHFWLVR